MKKRSGVLPPNISSAKYAAKIAAARKEGGNEKQSHWEARLAIVMKRRKRTARRASTGQ
jgi:hypothetical protein